VRVGVEDVQRLLRFLLTVKMLSWFHIMGQLRNMIYRQAS